MNTRQSLVITLICIALIGAQTQAQTLPNSQTQSAGLGLEEIVVTATRREESVEKVPISINALSAADLAQAGIKSISDLAAVTPGLQFTTPNSFSSTITTITIRGLNSNAGPSPVGLYLDDTPIQSRLNFITNIGNPYPMVFDLDRVEVARGPQGTLFGAGAEAGTVRFIANQPSLSNFSGFTHAEASMTAHGDPSYEIGAAAGGPIVDDKVGYRVSAWTQTVGGYVDRLDPLTGAIVAKNGNKNENSAFRGALTFKVGDVRITPSMYFQTFHSDDSPRWLGNYSNAGQGKFVNIGFIPETNTDSLALPSLKIEATLPFADFVSNTSYIHRNVRVFTDESSWLCANLGGCGNPAGVGNPSTPNDFTPSIFGLKVKGVTEEARLASNHPESFVTWVAGIYFDHRSQDDIQNQSSASQSPSTIVDIVQHTADQQIAAFAQVDLHVTKKLTATFGERVAKVTVDSTNYIGPGLFDGGLSRFMSSRTKCLGQKERLSLLRLPR